MCIHVCCMCIHVCCMLCSGQRLPDTQTEKAVKTARRPGPDWTRECLETVRSTPPARPCWHLAKSSRQAAFAQPSVSWVGLLEDGSCMSQCSSMYHCNDSLPLPGPRCKAWGFKATVLQAKSTWSYNRAAVDSLNPHSLFTASLSQRLASRAPRQHAAVGATVCTQCTHCVHTVRTLCTHSVSAEMTSCLTVDDGLVHVVGDVSAHLVWVSLGGTERGGGGEDVWVCVCACLCVCVC